MKLNSLEEGYTSAFFANVYSEASYNTCHEKTLCDRVMGKLCVTTRTNETKTLLPFQSFQTNKQMNKTKVSWCSKSSCNFLRRIKELNMILLSPRIEDFAFLSKPFQALQDLLFNSSLLTQTFVPPGVWNPIEQRNGS